MATATRKAQVRRPDLKAPPLLAVPMMGWFLWFFLVPLAIVLVYSFASRGTYGGVEFRWSLANYERATDWIYLRILGNSVLLASTTAVSCLLLGFPMAYALACARPALRSLLMILVIVPFWTNFVVRAYAIKVLLAETGPINAIATAMGLWSAPFDLGGGPFAVWFGMVTNYLPFMVLPLYVALDRFDFGLLEAARDLGANSTQAMRRVLIPLVRPGIVTGLVFVFTPALGEFVIPDMLGGARTMLIGNLVTEQFLKTRDWPFGAALSLLLIVVVMASLAIYLRLGEARESR